MALIAYSKDTIVPYVPSFDRGNTVDPCVIHLKFMTQSVRENYIRAGRENRSQNEQKIKSIKSKAEREKARENLEIDYTLSALKAQFVAHVVRVENVYDSEGKPVSDVEQAYELFDMNLKQEIMLAIQDAQVLSEGEKKPLLRQ